MKSPVIDKYEAWESVRRSHQAGVFDTNVLRTIESLLPQRVENSAETGCGKSTILFSNISDHHTVFALNDRDAGEGSSVLFYEECPLTRMDRITFIAGPTQQTLPAFDQFRPLDLLLIDGPHGFPFPELEYYYFYPHLRPGALLILDDVQIPTIGRLADFLAEDEMFETVDLVEGTAIFRRTDAPTFDPLQDGWWTQRYNRRRVSSKRDIFLPSESVTDHFTEQHLDCRLHEGEGFEDHQNKTLNEQIERLNITLGKRDEEIVNLRKEIDAANSTLNQLFSSSSWRITAPIRQFMGWLR